MSKRHIPIGELVGTHGIAGWLKLKLFNPSSTCLTSAREIFLACGSRSEGYAVEKAKPHKRILLIKLRDVNTIDAAEQLIGCRLSVPEDALEPLRANEYLYADVIGLDVFDTAGEYLGKITRVWLREGGDLYVVHYGLREHLIPVVRDIIEQVDLINQRMVVDLPAGFLDL